ncbi:hypothetical protein MWU59_07540 [Flavobacteriaceae bacterium F08102]|nr:hypothetical protein [Flavobacteriaceae bacterium F08102]
MYVNAEIITESSREWTLPESAIFQDSDHYYIFQAAKENEGSRAFEPKEIFVKFVRNGFTAFALKDPIASGTLIAQSGAYFLMVEMKKK